MNSERLLISRSISILLLGGLLSTTGVQAAQVTVDADKLSNSAKAEIAKLSRQESNWAGIGKEIGTAVNEALGSVVDQSDRFGKTDVGRFTMFLVGWRLLGRDIVFYSFAIIVTFIINGLLAWSYRRSCLTYRILIEKSKANGKRWELVNAKRDIHDPRWGVAGAHAFLFFLMNVILLISIGTR